MVGLHSQIVKITFKLIIETIILFLFFFYDTNNMLPFMNKFTILFLFLFFVVIKAEIEQGCLSQKECTDKQGNSYGCSSHGKCDYNLLIDNQSSISIDVRCQCATGYTNLNSTPEVYCCYKQKSQLKALLFEVCLGWGIGHFYVGNRKLGSIKLIVFGAIFGFHVLAWFEACGCRGKNSKGFMKVIGTIIGIITGMTVIGWQMLDLFLFGLNYFKDENGVELTPW